MKPRTQKVISVPPGREFVHRGARPRLSHPTCSIVVTSRGTAREAQVAIDPILHRIANSGIEVVSVRAGAGPEQTGSARPQAGVSMIVSAADGRDRLREIGLARCSGDIVAFIDDPADLTACWADRLRERVRGIAAGEEGRVRRLALSVVVPVHTQTCLAQVLEALAASDLPRSRWELIVVTDASDPATEAAAATHADFIVRLRRGSPWGPAYARNRGFEASTGQAVAFIDGDVQVRPDTLSQLVEALESRDDISAVFGSYDDVPSAKGVVSQYRNLLEHYCRQRYGGDAATFSAACGAIRSHVFVEAGMYDEWRFRRPQLEDLDLGRRIKSRGHTIILRPDIQATHLKRWTLAGMLATDLRDRGLAWSRSFASRGAATIAQCHRKSASENTLLTGLAAVMAVAAVVGSSGWMIAGVATLLLGVLWNNRAQLRWFADRRGIAFAAATIPLDLARNLVHAIAAVAGTLAREVVGESSPDVVVQAYAEVGLKTWPPVPRRR